MPEEDSELTKHAQPFHVANAVQLVLSSIVVLWSLFFAYLLCITKVYHRNLQLLLVNLPFTYALTCFCHMVSNLITILNGSEVIVGVVSNIMCTGLFASALNIFLILLERSIASFLARSYEMMDQGFPILVCTFINIQFLACVLSGVMSSFHLISNQLLVLISLFLNIVAFVGFALIPAKAYRQYITSSRNLSSHTLSERYQLAENYKSARLLNRVVLVICVTTFMATVVYYVGHFVIDLNKIDQRIMDFLFIITLFVQAIGIPVVIAALSKKFRDKCCVTFCGKTARVEHAVHIRNLKGNDLVVDVHRQRDVYFTEYQNAWR
ncbi:hypothetical protein QR680_000939 [Steinernema hermaphroditum]|uniref:Uncharacterized protein n=1 Tax=Steinernema hermaphroditum TaxID=289476 RepID=A0AA39GX58_9BILA|nr:hypothetical protein QR680_000939 [Steinernema hermaphroditum]